MRFYFQNNAGEKGHFTEKCLIRAIYSAWNIESDLYILKDRTKFINQSAILDGKVKLIFSPFESNEFNSDLLGEYGYKMIDGDKYRE
jgi:hypothetical protein